MERLESARRWWTRSTRRVDELRASGPTCGPRRRRQTADLDSEEARLAPQGGELPAGPLLGLYERVRTSMNGGGVGAAALQDGRCEGCRMPLAPTEIARISSLGADAVVQCDECRRILVRVRGRRGRDGRRAGG